MKYCKSSKEKLNTKSSTEVEVVATSDMMIGGKMLWTLLYFLQSQGYEECITAECLAHIEE